MSDSGCDILHAIATSPWPATTDRLLGALGDADTLCVIDTGVDCPAADLLRERADRLVDGRGLRKLLAAFALRRIVGEMRPARLHVWGAEALAPAGAAAGKRPMTATLVDLPTSRRRRELARRRAIGRCERIACGDAAVAEAVKQLGAKADRLEVLPAPQIGPADLPTKAEARRRLGLPADVPVVLTAGPWPRRAGVEPTVWAVGFVARIWPDTRMLMVHNGRLEPYVHGSVTANDLALPPVAVAAAGTRLPAEALAAADCFLAAPHRIGPSLAAAEAATAGLPIVAAATASSRAQLAGAGGVYFCRKPLPLNMARALYRVLGSLEQFPGAEATKPAGLR